MQMRTFGLIVLALACLGVAYYAIATYAGGIPSGMQAGAATPEVLYVHVFASLVALALGPLQFAASLRARHPRLHRNSGRLYLLGVFVGGGAGMAPMRSHKSCRRLWPRMCCSSVGARSRKAARPQCQPVALATS